MSERLIVFTRYSEPGKSKTRLIPALGPAGAACVGREMTRHTLRWAGELVSMRSVSVDVRFDGGDETLMRHCFGDRFGFLPQAPGDLGERMRHAFESAFRAGAARAVIVGTDCPDLTAQVVATAFDRLAQNDLVLGPATDGGYYLIGLGRRAPELFAQIPWGSGAVLEETLGVAEAANLSTVLLEPLCDVDRPEDLLVWERARSRAFTDVADARISVVIPTLDESAYLPNALGSLQGEENLETIVVDAGSHDQTQPIAREHGCKVLVAGGGRARQLNAGADAAIGSILLFLHADTQLPEHFGDHVRRALGRPGVVAGAFPLRIDAPRRTLRVIEAAVNLRCRWLKMPYGDQAIFLPADEFYRVGGFPELPIMEDFELVRRLRRRGRIAMAMAPVVTSARRWQSVGPWRTTWINQRVVLGYYLGISPHRLARWYRDAGPE
jgi:rSAM/selenodomain-associated transferase 2/rSAM/selenodomain-associated transferase 1